MFLLKNGTGIIDATVFVFKDVVGYFQENAIMFEHDFTKQKWTPNLPSWLVMLSCINSVYFLLFVKFEIDVLKFDSILICSLISIFALYRNYITYKHKAMLIFDFKAIYMYRKCFFFNLKSSTVSAHSQNIKPKER